MSLFTNHTLEEHTQALANYYPNGKVWIAKNKTESNLRALLKGYSGEFQRVEALLNEMYSESYAPETTDYINEWESAVGIPDDCFSGTGTIEERRANVVIKLAALGVQTEQDFIDLAALLGFTITIERPVDSGAFPPYDVAFDVLDLKVARFTWIIKGVGIVAGVPPYDVAFDVDGAGNGNIMQCLFQKLKPANTSLIFQNA